MTLAELSKHFKYSPKHLNLLARKGRIKAHKQGRNWVSTIDAIKEYRNQH